MQSDRNRCFTLAYYWQWNKFVVEYNVEKNIAEYEHEEDYYILRINNTLLLSNCLPVHSYEKNLYPLTTIIGFFK
jgi:hypothetical protein